MHTNEDDLAFLEGIRQAPYDDAPRLVYADWLEERDDSRYEYIREMYEIIGHIRAGTNYDHLDIPFRELAERYLSEWRNVVSKRFDVTLESFDVAMHKISVIKVIRELTAVGLSDAKQLSEAVPQTVREELPLENALASRRSLQSGRAGDPTNPHDWPPTEKPQIAVVSLSESAEVVDINSASAWLQHFRDFPTKRLYLLDRLRHLLPQSELIQFLTTEVLDSSLPEGLRTMMLEQLNRAQNLSTQEEEGVIQAVLTLANREDSMRVRTKALVILERKNLRRQFDPFLIRLVQNRGENTILRENAVGRLRHHLTDQQFQNYESALLPVLIDENEEDNVRYALFRLFTDHPCEHLHELFRTLRGGYYLENGVEIYFEELENERMRETE